MFAAENLAKRKKGKTKYLDRRSGGSSSIRVEIRPCFEMWRKKEDDEEEDEELYTAHVIAVKAECSEVVVAYVAELKGKDRRRYFNPSIFNPFNFARVR